MRTRIMSRKAEPPTNGEERRQFGDLEVRLAWRKAGFCEFLAWCYLPGPDGLHNQGVGFEARASTVDGALRKLAARVEGHLAIR